MPENKPKPSALRIVVPLVAVMLGLLIVLSVSRKGSNTAAQKDDGKTQTTEDKKKGGESTKTKTSGDDSKADKDKDTGKDADKGDDNDKPKKAEDDKADDDPAKPKANTLTVGEDDLNDQLKAFNLQAGDEIISVNGQPPTDFATLTQTILAGEAVELLIKRDGKEIPLVLDKDGSVKVKPEKIDPFDNLRPDYAPQPAKKKDETTAVYSLGSADPDGDHKLFVEINPYRACVHRITLSKVAEQANKPERYVLLHPIDLNFGDKKYKYPTLGSYAAEFIQINKTKVALFQQSAKDQGKGYWHLSKDDKPGDNEVKLTLTIKGGKGEGVDVVRITRTYRVEPGSHTVHLKQTVTNLLDEKLHKEPLAIKWQQLAQGDVHLEKNDYLRGRSRQFVTAYFDEENDKQRFSIYVKDDAFISRPDLVNDLKNPEKEKWSVWPNPDLKTSDKTLAWLASDNRFFAAITSAHVGDDVKETADVTALEKIYPTISTTVFPTEQNDKDMDSDERVVLIGLTSQELTLKPGKTTDAADLSLDLFAGPRMNKIFKEDRYAALHFDKTIRYSLGGFCGCCTFQWLAHLLLSFLRLLHAITMDWGLAIILLVLVVRLCLHPLTKRGQIAMMKMGKQMAAVQPELDKLKKKFADEPREMQQAQMQLFREKGINPAAGAMGCLPMLLQMPIWIALYAMLYYVSDLRHEPAFYGLFQTIGNWGFLADLSNADRFIPLGPNDGSMVISLLFIRFDYSAINILPLLMGVTFYINMKYTTPPPMNEQQATQQKIMKIMPLMFPFFLYSAPSSLTLYICASTFAGIIDSRIVRKHVKEMEESGELFKPRKVKSGGFMDRMQKAAELRAKQMEEMKKQKAQQQGKGGGGNKYKKRKR